MKTDFFKNALNLSVEELVEVHKIKINLNEIIEKKVRISEVKAGFKCLEVEICSFPDNRTFRVEEDTTTFLYTSVGLIRVNNEIGEVILQAIREKQEKEEFICVKLLPL